MRAKAKTFSLNALRLVVTLSMALSLLPAMPAAAAPEASPVAAPGSLFAAASLASMEEGESAPDVTFNHANGTLWGARTMTLRGYENKTVVTARTQTDPTTTFDSATDATTVEAEPDLEIDKDILIDDLGTPALDDDTLPADTPETDEEVTVLGSPGVEITKALVDPLDGVAVISDTITYTVRITNTGDTAITRLPLYDYYCPACLEFTSWSITPTDVDEDLGTVYWADVLSPTLGGPGILPPGESITVTVDFHATITETMYWKEKWHDYALSGMPDFDQKQDGWFDPASGRWTFCGPVAAANSIWWFDSKFEDPNSPPPPTVNDSYGLVTPYGAWDDHDPQNVQPLVNALAGLMQTSPITGTHVHNLAAGVAQYITNTVGPGQYTVTAVSRPEFELIEEEVRRSEDVILLLGFWQDLGGGYFERSGGHFVTVAGVDSASLRLALSDPYRDGAEQGLSDGRVRPNPHASRHPDPDNETAHNDAWYTSHDVYDVAASPTPGGIWSLPGYTLVCDALVANFNGQNEGDFVNGLPCDPGTPWPVFTEIEYMVAVSPITATVVCSPTNNVAVVSGALDEYGFEAPEAQDNAAVTIENPVIGVAKVVSSTVNLGDGRYTVVYTITVENLGGVVLSHAQVTDDLASTFAGATSFSVLSKTSADFTVNPGYNGSTNTNLLAAGNSLAVGASGTIVLTVRVRPGGNLGPYDNQAMASGTSPGGSTVTDLSDDGLDPDPDGDGNPNEAGENDPTPVTFTENPVIGVAKAVSSLANHGDGTYTVVYTLTVENLGDVPLINLQVTDSLTTTFSGAVSYTVDNVTSSDFTLNGGYDGDADTSLLAGSDTLATGASGRIVLTVTVTPGASLGPYDNQAWASATGPGGTPTGDLSDDGIDPDPNSNGDPTEAGENDPTPVTFTENPVIGVAKDVATVVNHGDGTYAVTYTLVVENLGDVVLSGVQVTDDLSIAFGGAVSYTVDSVGSADFAVNGGYDGDTDVNLLAGTDSLAVGASGTITLAVTVTPGASLGPYNNQARATGTSPAGTTVSDLSDDGSDPDPDGDGDPTEAGENDPTPVTFPENPVIGVAKKVSSLVNNGDGTYTVAYTLTVENLGDMVLHGLQVRDNLGTTFAGATGFLVNSVSSGDFTVNPGYTGLLPNTSLLMGTDSQAVGQTGTIVLVVTVTPGGNLGPYNNQATAIGVSPANATVTDFSDDGSDPDPDGDGNPNEAGENDPTPVTFAENPVIGVAKAVSSLANHGDGTYTVVYTLTVENLGDVPLIHLQVTDSLTTTFSSAVSYTVDNVTSSDFTPNGGYDGDADTSLLAGSDTLATGASGTIVLTVTVRPGGNLGPYDNQAWASATGSGGTPANDLSDDGSDPDPDGDGNPNEAGENDPTPVTFTENPVIGVAKAVSSLANHGDGTYTVVYTLTVENLGDVPLIHLQVTDSLTTTFSGAVSYTVDNVTSSDFAVNGGYDGDTDVNLLAGTDGLATGASGRIVLTVTVTPGASLGPYDNQARASASGPGGTPTSDLSDDGFDPDPDGDGNPDEAGENDATPVTFTENPVVGVAKAVQAQVSNGDGTHTVTYTLVVENLGDVVLSGVQVTDDLSITFAGAVSYTVDSVGSADFAVNGGYDGDTDVNLLAGSDSLAVGASGTITLAVRVTPDGNLGPYSNQARARANSPAGTTVSDWSDDGLDPDPNGNGDPTEAGENDPTLVILGENPVIGAAKAVFSVTDNGDCTQTVVYTLVVENLGDVRLDNVQVTDNLANTFEGSAGFAVDSVSSDVFTANGAYSGSPPNTSLLVGSDSLAIGQTGTITLTVTVTPCAKLGPYFNQATAVGTSPGGMSTIDLSDDGLDPDPDGDGNPNEAGENDATPVTFTENPVVGVAKAVSSVANHGDGTYTVAYTLTVENLGNVTLNDVQVADNLASTFSGAVEFTVDSVSSSDFTLNGGYNGSSNTNLLAGSDSLTLWQTGTIQLLVTVTPGSNLGPYNNRATATATGPGGTPTSDNSDDGLDPDPDGDGNPNEAGENDPTPVTFTEHPVIGAAKDVASVANNGDGTFTVVYSNTVENMGDVVLHNVVVTDDLDITFAGAVAYTVTNVSTTGILAANWPGYDGSSDQNLVTLGQDLEVGEVETIVLTVILDPGSNPGPYNNSVYVRGTSPGGQEVTDWSDPGINPDPNGNGDPSDGGSEDNPTPLQLAMVWGHIFEDTNGNGVKDPGEPPLVGVRVVITDSSGVTQTVTTDASGNYTATVTAGLTTADVDESTLPFGYGQTAGSDPTTVNAPEGSLTHVGDDGYQAQGTLGDRVWWDINGDGVQDVGEPGIPGVDVVLSDGVVLTTTTDASGFYTFTGVPAGTCTITIPAYEFQPGGTLYNWVASPQNVGSDDTVDSDGDPLTHQITTTLMAGEVDLSNDFGFDISSSYTVTKQLNTVEPVLVIHPLTVTIRITNTGNSWITVLPLQDVYSTTYLTYGYTDTTVFPPVATWAVPDSDDHNDDGVIDWSDLTLTEGDLAPGASITVIVTFTARADTHGVGLPNDETEDVAIVHGAFADPDGAGPLPPQPLPTQQESEGVEIIYPTGVMLTDLSGVAQADGVLLGWQMANEAAVLGFNVLRGEAGGEWVLLNQEFIFAQYAGAGRGAVYTYQDDAVISGITYEYVLQVVTTDGRVEQYGPTRVTVGWWVRLPLIAR